MSSANGTRSVWLIIWAGTGNAEDVSTRHFSAANVALVPNAISSPMPVWQTTTLRELPSTLLEPPSAHHPLDDVAFWCCCCFLVATPTGFQQHQPLGTSHATCSQRLNRPAVPEQQFPTALLSEDDLRNCFLQQSWNVSECTLEEMIDAPLNLATSDGGRVCHPPTAFPHLLRLPAPPFKPPLLPPLTSQNAQNNLTINQLPLLISRRVKNRTSQTRHSHTSASLLGKFAG